MKAKILIPILLVVGSFMIGGCAYLPTGDITQGVHIEDTNVSGMTRKELSEYITSLNKEINHTITISGNGKQREVTLSDLGIKIDLPKLEGAVISYGYELDALTLIQNRFVGVVYGKHFTIPYILDEVKARALLLEFSKTIDTPGHDAYFTIENGQPVMHSAKLGEHVDIDATIQKLKESLTDKSFNSITLVMTNKETVSVTDDELKPLQTILASYTTHFDSNNVNRTHNIEIASTKINGTLLRKGEVFSFNDVVGERTAEAGFDDAPVMIEGKLVPGIGGGICQVSSTLFNSALLSGMDIVERTPHFEPVSYIPAGRDATVAYGYLDFQFKNSYNHVVYILSTISGGELTIYVIGVKEDKPQSVDITVGGETVISNQTETRIDLSIEGDVVTEGHNGLQMVTTRHIIYGNGSSNTTTYDSVYDPVNTIIVKGKPKKVEPKQNDKKKEDTNKPN